MSYLALKMGKRGFIRCMKNTITRISNNNKMINYKKLIILPVLVLFIMNATYWKLMITFKIFASH